MRTVLAFALLALLAHPVRADRLTYADELAVGMSGFLLPVPAAMRAAASFRNPGEFLVVPMLAVAFARASTPHRSLELRFDSVGYASRLLAGVRWRVIDRAVAPYAALRLGASNLLPPLAENPLDFQVSASAVLGVEVVVHATTEVDVEFEVSAFAGAPVAGVTLVVGGRWHR